MPSNQQANPGPNVLLTGPPGIGKTTVVKRLVERLAGPRVAGFYTEEIRTGGVREGFSLTTFSGQTAVLAHVGFKTQLRVGRYKVDVPTFENLVLPELHRPCDLTVIDEIGKMECFSWRFVEAVRKVLDSPTPVIATVARKGGGFIAEVKSRADCHIWEVTGANRDGLPRRLRERLGGAGSPSGG